MLARDGSVDGVLQLADVRNLDAKRLHDMLATRRVVLDARLGGLAEWPARCQGGCPGDDRWRRASQRSPRKMASVFWSEERLRGSIGFRVRVAQHGVRETHWKVAYRRFIDERSEQVDDIDAQLEWRVEEWVGDGAAESEPALRRPNRSRSPSRVHRAACRCDCRETELAGRTCASCWPPRHGIMMPARRARSGSVMPEMRALRAIGRSTLRSRSSPRAGRRGCSKWEEDVPSRVRVGS